MSIKEFIASVNLLRFGRSTQLVERAYRNPVLPERKVTAWQLDQNRVAITTTAIAGGSVPSPGTGTVDLYRFNPLTGTSTLEESGVTVYNTQAGSVPSGVGVQLKAIDGGLFVDVAPCPP